VPLAEDGSNYTKRVIIWLKARLQPNIGNTIARFDGIHVFEYSSAESESILMKSGELWLHSRGLALADFWCDPRSSKSWREPGEILCIFVR